MSLDQGEPTARICRRCGHAATAPPGARCPTDRQALIDLRVHRAAPDDPLLGEVLGDKYLLLELIGRGGFGSVYRALQEPVDQVVAVKVVRERPGDSKAYLARFAQEARVIAALRHHNTVRLHDFGEADDRLFMVLEYVVGRTLSSVIRRDGPLLPARAVGIARQVLESLHEAHKLGLVHRDLKPANIMLARSPFGAETVKVLDFGLARLLGPSERRYTAQGHVVGSPAYMPPEQIDGETGPESDLYSLGVVLFEMLSGRKPFPGPDRQQMIIGHLQSAPPPLPGAPAALESVIRTALAKKPTDRFRSAAEMADALDAALRGGGISTPVLPPTRPAVSVRHATGLVSIGGAETPAPIVGERTVSMNLTPALQPRRWPWVVGAAALLAVVVGLTWPDPLPPPAPEAMRPALPALPRDPVMPAPPTRAAPEARPTPPPPEAPPAFADPTEAQAAPDAAPRPLPKRSRPAPPPSTPKDDDWI